MKNESDVFSLYTAADSLRPALMNPFVEGTYAYAADGHILIRVNKAIVNGEYTTHEKSPGCQKLFMGTNKEFVIKFSELEQKLSQVELIEELRQIGEDIECDECEGCGEVTWEYKRWSEDFKCPVCEGTGYLKRSKKVPTGKMIPNLGKSINLDVKSFKARYIKTLVDTMSLLDIREITMKYNIGYKYEAVIFNFNTDIDVLLMPYIVD